jgi:hypothetical protein
VVDDHLASGPTNGVGSADDTSADDGADAAPDASGDYPDTDGDGVPDQEDAQNGVYEDDYDGDGILDQDE